MRSATPTGRTGDVWRYRVATRGELHGVRHRLAPPRGRSGGSDDVSPPGRGGGRAAPGPTDDALSPDEEGRGNALTGAAGTPGRGRRSEHRSWLLVGGAVASLVVGASLAAVFPVLHGYAATESPVGFAPTYPFSAFERFIPERVDDWNRPLVWLIGPPYVAVYAALQPRLGHGLPAFLFDCALLGLALVIVVANARNLWATAGFRAAVVDAATPRARLGYWTAAIPGLLLLVVGSVV